MLPNTNIHKQRTPNARACPGTDSKLESARWIPDSSRESHTDTQETGRTPMFDAAEKDRIDVAEFRAASSGNPWIPAGSIQRYGHISVCVGYNTRNLWQQVRSLPSIIHLKSLKRLSVDPKSYPKLRFLISCLSRRALQIQASHGFRRIDSHSPAVQPPASLGAIPVRLEEPRQNASLVLVDKASAGCSCFWHQKRFIKPAYSPST